MVARGEPPRDTHVEPVRRRDRTSRIDVGSQLALVGGASAAPTDLRRTRDNFDVARPVTPLPWLHMGDPEWLSLGDR
jgi:hypothetical protein